jgi:hypothetical protein
MFIKNFSKVLIITIGLLLTISKSYAGILSPVADLYLTLEFNKSYLSHKNINSNFSRNYNFKDNISNFNDVAIGANLKIFGSFGVNFNWSQTSLKNDNLYGVNNLENQAKYKSDQFNLTGLFYIPIIPTRAQIFLEAGVADIGSKLSYNQTDKININRSSNQLIGLYGFGAQISPFGGDYLRFSVHRYTGKMKLLDTNYTSIRVGYLKAI